MAGDELDRDGAAERPAAGGPGGEALDAASEHAAGGGGGAPEGVSGGGGAPGGVAGDGDGTPGGLAGDGDGAPGGVAGEGGGSIAWTSHPFRRQPGRGLALLALLALAAVLIGWWCRSWFWGVFAAGVLFLSLETYFFPTRYALDEKEVVVRKPFSASRNPWDAFRRVYEDRHGLTLSPYRRKTFLEPYRSQRLLFDGGDAERIRSAVRARCPEAEWLRAAGKGMAAS